MEARNALRADEIPPGGHRNARSPMERPAVRVRIVEPAGERWYDGRALSWAGTAVWVEVWDGALNHEVWLSASDVEWRETT